MKKGPVAEIDGLMDISTMFMLSLLHNGTLQKEMGSLTLLRLSQLQLNDIMSPPTLGYFSYTLETEGMWAICRVSPK